jgi:hypothetical protein
MLCPCCNQPVTRPDPLKLIQHADLAGVCRIVAMHLARHFGQPVLIDAVVEEVYSGVRDGGPQDGRESVRQITHQLRGKLAPFGLRIEGRGGRGRSGSWRMTWDASGK